MTIGFAPGQARSARLAILLLPVAVLIGWASTHQPRLLLFGAVALGVGAALIVDSWLPALIAVPGAYIDARLGGSATLSVTDVLVFAGALVPLLRLDWRNEEHLGRAFLPLLAYLALLLPALVHPVSVTGTAEWLHRGVIVVGGLLIGAYLAERGMTRVAIMVYLAVSGGVAALAVVQAPLIHFQPVYVLGLQKNYAGSLLSSAFLLTYALAPRTKRERLLRRGVQLLLIGGLLAVRSRGGLVGVLGGSLILAFVAKRSRWLNVSMLIAGVVLAVYSVRDELINNPTFGSAATHISIAKLALKAWASSPVVGQGLKLWTTGAFDLVIDPHNEVLLTLAESGLMGLLGLAILLTWTGANLAHLRTPLGYTALALLVGRFVHGLFDVYWVHGSQTLPWIVAGLAIGEATLLARKAQASAAT